MSRVFLDTNILIYLMEDYGEVSTQVANLALRMKARKDVLITSTMTLGEIMVKPYADRNDVLVQRYQSFFESPSLELVNFDEVAAWEYAVVRQDKYIKAPDAIQLACAAAVKCDLFITNDDRLSKKVVPGIQFIVSLDRVPI